MWGALAALAASPLRFPPPRPPHPAQTARPQAFGVVSEQIKTRRELEEAQGKAVAEAQEVVTPEGLRYRDLRLGGGPQPQKGLLIVLDYKVGSC